jgi:hypothetical protein
MVFPGTPWQSIPRKTHVSTTRIFIICGLAEKVRSAEHGIALLLVGCCQIKLLK